MMLGACLDPPRPGHDDNAERRMEAAGHQASRASSETRTGEIKDSTTVPSSASCTEKSIEARGSSAAEKPAVFDEVTWTGGVSTNAQSLKKQEGRETAWNSVRESSKKVLCSDRVSSSQHFPSSRASGMDSSSGYAKDSLCARREKPKLE